MVKGPRFGSSLYCITCTSHTHTYTHTHTRWLQVANKLLELHIQLKDLGHPKYVKPVETRILECKTHLDKADGEVHMFMYVVFVSTYTYASLPMVHMYSSLGFPHSQKHTFSPSQVADTESLLTAWARSVTKLRSQHQWLLFFSVPKQLLLFQLIQQLEEGREEEIADQVVKEVMFLVTNDPRARDKIKDSVLVSYLNCSF